MHLQCLWGSEWLNEQNKMLLLVFQGKPEVTVLCLKDIMRARGVHAVSAELRKASRGLGFCNTGACTSQTVPCSTLFENPGATQTTLCTQHSTMETQGTVLTWSTAHYLPLHAQLLIIIRMHSSHSACWLVEKGGADVPWMTCLPVLGSNPAFLQNLSGKIQKGHLCMETFYWAPISLLSQGVRTQGHKNVFI